MSNWYLLTNGYRYCHIPKNACTSIDQHRVSIHPIFPLTGEKCIAVFRNPFDRLASAFKNKLESFPAETWGEFIDHICETPDETIDVHARAQHMFMKPWPEIIIRFDRVGEEFEKLGITLDHLNKSNGAPWEDYFSEEDQVRVVKRYKPDFQIWRELCQAETT